MSGGQRLWGGALGAIGISSLGDGNILELKGGFACPCEYTKTH